MNKEKKMYINKIMNKISGGYGTESEVRKLVEKELHKLTITSLSCLYAMTLSLNIVEGIKDLPDEERKERN